MAYLGRVSFPSESVDEYGSLVLEFNDGSYALMDVNKTTIISFNENNSQAERYLRAYYPSQVANFENRLKNTFVKLPEYATQLPLPMTLPAPLPSPGTVQLTPQQIEAQVKQAPQAGGLALAAIAAFLILGA